MSLFLRDFTKTYYFVKNQGGLRNPCNTCHLIPDQLIRGIDEDSPLFSFQERQNCSNGLPRARFRDQKKVFMPLPLIHNHGLVGVELNPCFRMIDQRKL